MIPDLIRTCPLLVRVVALLAVASTAWSGGDIVYSARYYKPGWTPSSYHLWRINPDGSGRQAVTSGNDDDFEPVWLADGQTILFVRDDLQTQRLCRVSAAGGPVTTVAIIPQRHFSQSLRCLSPDRRFYIMRGGRDYPWNLLRLDLKTGDIRNLGRRRDVSWSPDSSRLYVRNNAMPKGRHSFALNMAEWTVQPLGDDLGPAAWLDNDTLVAEQTAQPLKTVLVTMDSCGRRQSQVSVPFEQYDGYGSFADVLYTIPGTCDAIIYGQHAGGSSQGPAQDFYRVDLRTGAQAFLASGRDLVWSPDGKTFCTAAGQDLAPINGHHSAWVSTLSIVNLADGRQRKIVEGLVCVDGFDWRPSPARRK